jgi:hypothetical protein
MNKTIAHGKNHKRRGRASPIATLMTAVFTLTLTVLSLNLPCTADTNSASKKKTSSDTKLQSEKPVLGTVQETKLFGKVDVLGSACTDVGIKLSSNKLPATVEKVELGSAAQAANIDVDDKILAAEIKGNKFCLSLERNRQKYYAEVNLSSEFASAAKNQSLTGKVQELSSVLSGRNTMEILPRVVVNFYQVEGPGIGDIDLTAVFTDGENRFTMVPNGPGAGVGGGRVYSAHYEMFDNRPGSFETNGSRFGNADHRIEIKPLPADRGSMPGEDVQEFINFARSNLMADLLVVNIGEIECGGGSANCRFNVTVNGSQPRQGHYKTAVICNMFRCKGGGSKNSDFDINTTPCSRAIAGAQNTRIYNIKRYNFGQWENCRYNFDGQRGSGVPNFVLRDNDNASRELLNFLIQVKEYTHRQMVSRFQK